MLQHQIVYVKVTFTIPRVLRAAIVRANIAVRVQHDVNLEASCVTYFITHRKVLDPINHKNNLFE